GAQYWGRRVVPRCEGGGTGAPISIRKRRNPSAQEVVAPVRQGRDCPVSLPLNRREMLGACGVMGAATAAALVTPTAARGDHVELGRFVKRAGVQGKMTGAQAVAAALACEGVPCLFGVPGAQNNELWDALKARGVPYML